MPRPNRHSHCLCLGLLIACVTGLGTASVRSATVWIDTDPTIGSPFCDVDDAFALILAFHAAQLRIAGISTTYGNASLTRTTSVARDLAARFGQQAGITAEKVYAGAASAGDIRRRTAASEALARALRKKKLSFVALGPLTNLAAFLEQHPNLAGHFEQVIFVGGKSSGRQLAFGRSGEWRIHDANVFKDPAAVRRIMNAKIPLVLAPVETSSQLMLLPDEFRKLGQSAGPGDFLYRRSKIWMWFWTGIVGEKGGPVFDALAVIAAARPDLVVTEKRFAAVNQSGDLIAARVVTDHTRAVRVCTRRTKGAKQFLLETLSANRSTR